MAENHKPLSPTAQKKAYLIRRDHPQVNMCFQDLLMERVLPVWINGALAMKIVCTPCDLKELILGHLLSEGRISGLSQVQSITFSENPVSADVRIDFSDSRQSAPLEIRACDCGANGILGRAEIDNWKPSSDSGSFSWTREDIFLLADTFQELTPLYQKTRGIHSCLLMYGGEIRYTCEDIGRHNALDKVIGHALLDGLDLGKCIVYSSGRIPEDMIAKAIRSGIPVLASKATPTARAVELALRHHITLICGARSDSMKVFSCRELWEFPVSAGILAGGTSSRMGRNKIFLENHGATFLSYLQRQCAFLPEILVSFCSRDQIGEWSGPHVLDEKQMFGPLEGIYQLLLAASHDHVLILAADMQCLDQAFLETFLHQLKPEDDCMILKSEKGLEPLCGVYRKSVLPVLEQMRQDGIHRPRLLFDRVNTHYVTASDLGMTEEALSFRVNNINTPEDYQDFLKNHQ